METERPEDILVEFFGAAFGCHTLVLYGSRATGLAKEGSDWDIIGVNDWNRRSWYNDTIQGVEGDVNAFIYPEAGMRSAHMADILNLKQFCFGIRTGVVLCEKDGLGQKIVAAANTIYATPPAPLTPGFAQTVQHYFDDVVIGTMQKPHVPDLVKQYRHHEAIVKSLFNYFSLRGKLRPPAKEACIYLRDHDHEGYVKFCRAAAPNASTEALAAWLKHVMHVQ